MWERDWTPGSASKERFTCAVEYKFDERSKSGFKGMVDCIGVNALRHVGFHRVSRHDAPRKPRRDHVAGGVAKGAKRLAVRPPPHDRQNIKQGNCRKDVALLDGILRRRQPYSFSNP